MSIVVEGREGNEIIGVIPEEGKLLISFESKAARVVIGANVRFRNVAIHLLGNGEFIVGDECDLEGAFVVSDSSSISLGAKTTVCGHARLHASEQCKIVIGAGCVLNGSRFRTSDSHSVLDMSSMERINLAKDIVLGDSVYVDKHCFFYKGSRVGSGSYVAIGAIVTRKFENNCYIEGRPASATRTNISWSA